MVAPKRFPKNSILFKEGEKGDCIYFLNSGEVEIFKVSPSGPIHLSRIQKGSVFGEMSVINKEPRSGNALAITDVVVTEISNLEFNLQLEKIPHWYKSIISLSSIRIRATNQRLSSEKSVSTIPNVARTLYFIACWQSKNAQHLNTLFIINEISELLGLNQSTVKQSLQALEKAAVLAFERQEILVPDPDVLYGYSEFMRFNTLKQSNYKEFFYVLEVLPRLCNELKFGNSSTFYVEIFPLKKNLRQATRAELGFIEFFLKLLEKNHYLSFINAEESIKILHSFGDKTYVAKQFYRVDIHKINALFKAVKTLNLLKLS
jgi:CRP/FNR family transcriptional regulator, cyclic AMP receptor protein